MRVRCGRCQTPFDVTGPGRYACPSCGAANQVGDPGPPDAGSGFMPPPDPTVPEPSAEHERTTCPDCGFGFIVGDIDVAVCPNCSASVSVGPGI